MWFLRSLDLSDSVTGYKKNTGLRTQEIKTDKLYSGGLR